MVLNHSLSKHSPINIKITMSRDSYSKYNPYGMSGNGNGGGGGRSLIDPFGSLSSSSSSKKYGSNSGSSSSFSSSYSSSSSSSASSSPYNNNNSSSKYGSSSGGSTGSCGHKCVVCPGGGMKSTRTVETQTYTRDYTDNKYHNKMNFWYHKPSNSSSSSNSWRS